MIEQKYTGKSSYANQVTRLLKTYDFSNCDALLDYGGGKHDNNNSKYMNINYPRLEFVIYDPYNEDEEHNSLARVEKYYDIVTINNVLNILENDELIHYVVNDAKSLLKVNGCLMISFNRRSLNTPHIYKDTYHNGHSMDDYLNICKTHFSFVKRVGNDIICSDSSEMVAHCVNSKIRKE